MDEGVVRRRLRNLLLPITVQNRRSDPTFNHAPIAISDAAYCRKRLKAAVGCHNRRRLT
jgi:hypothetical protein